MKRRLGHANIFSGFWTHAPTPAPCLLQYKGTLAFRDNVLQKRGRERGQEKARHQGHGNARATPTGGTMKICNWCGLSRTSYMHMIACQRARQCSLPPNFCNAHLAACASAEHTLCTCHKYHIRKLGPFSGSRPTDGDASRNSPGNRPPQLRLNWLLQKTLSYLRQDGGRKILRCVIWGTTDTCTVEWPNTLVT